MNNDFKSEQAYDQDRFDRYVWRRQRATGLTRRQVLKDLAGLAAGVSTFGSLPLRAYGQAPPPIVKPTPPDKFRILGTNRETLFQAFKGQGYLTPASLFFVRNHTTTPRIDGETWSLSIEGSGVATPTTFTLDDLIAL